MSQRSLSIDSVVAAVEAGSADAAKVTAANIVVVMGQGGGKSTFVRYIMGHELSIDECSGQGCSSDSPSSAKTTETHHLSDSTTLVELPGELDIATANQQLRNSIQNTLVLSKAEEVRLALVLPLSSFCVDAQELDTGPGYPRSRLQHDDTAHPNAGSGAAPGSLMRSLHDIERLFTDVPSALRGVRVVISGARCGRNSQALSQLELIREVLPEVEKATEAARKDGVTNGMQLLNYIRSGLRRTDELCARSGGGTAFGPCMVFNPLDVASRPVMIEAIVGGSPVGSRPGASAFRPSLPVGITVDVDFVLRADQPARAAAPRENHHRAMVPQQERDDDFIVLSKPVQCPTLTTPLLFRTISVTRECIMLSDGSQDLRCRLCQREAFEMQTTWRCGECEDHFLVCDDCLRSEDFVMKHAHPPSRFSSEEIDLHSTSHFTIELQDRPIVVSIIPASLQPRKILEKVASSFVVLLQPSSVSPTKPVQGDILVRSVDSEVARIEISFCLAANGTCQLLVNGSVVAATEGLDMSVDYRIGFLHFEGQTIRCLGVEETPSVGSMRLIAPLKALRSFANESLNEETVCGKEGRVIKTTTSGRCILLVDETDRLLLDLPIAATRPTKPAPPRSLGIPLHEVVSLQAALQGKLKVQLCVDETPAAHRRAFRHFVEPADDHDGLVLAVAVAAAQVVLADPQDVVYCTPKIIGEVEVLRVRANRVISSFDAQLSVAADQMSGPHYKAGATPSPLAILFAEHRLALQDMLATVESLFEAADIPRWVKENEYDRRRARQFVDRVSIKRRPRSGPTMEGGYEEMN